MATPTFTKTGNKATTEAKLPKAVFGLKVDNHDLLKQAYVAYLANGRSVDAHTKTRGEVRGGGRKPWRQKGTGRARFGSSRVPIWRGGGITFGPTGAENHSHDLPLKAKRQAIRQALSLKSGNVIVIDNLDSLKKTTDAAKLFDKVGATGTILVAVENKTPELVRSVRNLPGLKLVQATYLNTFDVMNADTIVLTSGALTTVETWLGQKKPAAKQEAK
jgi:large subunit ribosomal protein L4